MSKQETRNEWVAIIAKFEASGQSQAAWCREKKLNNRTFNYWFRKFKNTNPKTSVSSNWIKINTDEIEENPKKSSLTVKIGKAAIEMNSDFDPTLLFNIVKVLSALC